SEGARPFADQRWRQPAPDIGGARHFRTLRTDRANQDRPRNDEYGRGVAPVVGDAGALSANGGVSSVGGLDRKPPRDTPHATGAGAPLARRRVAPPDDRNRRAADRAQGRHADHHRTSPQ